MNTPPVVVRETEVSDLTDIFRIRNDPAVRPNQYGVQADDSIDVWSQRLNGQQSGPVTFSCATILLSTVVDSCRGNVGADYARALSRLGSKKGVVVTSAVKRFMRPSS